MKGSVMKSYAYEKEDPMYSHLSSLSFLFVHSHSKSYSLMSTHTSLSLYTIAGLVFLKHKIDYASPCLKLLHIEYA